MKKQSKVVKILDEYNIIINLGFEQKLKLGDTFEILDNEGNTVFDPDTNQIIGRLDLVKATVEVTTLYEKMCICSSVNKISNLSSLNLNESINVTFGNYSREKLNVDLTQITGGKRKSNQKILLGDLVRLV